MMHQTDLPPTKRSIFPAYASNKNTTEQVPKLFSGFCPIQIQSTKVHKLFPNDEYEKNTTDRSPCIFFGDAPNENTNEQNILCLRVRWKEHQPISPIYVGVASIENITDQNYPSKETLTDGGFGIESGKSM